MKHNPNFRSVAHQGYSVTEQYYGNSRLSSYIGAAEMGFDYGETDIQFTADGIPVCSHDAAFLDTTDGIAKLTIAEHTLAELKQAGYFGETLATLEEVLYTCKMHGLGLYIDHLGEWDDARWNTVFSLVKKYSMTDRVAWLTCYPTILARIQAWYPPSALNLCTGNADLSRAIELAKSVKTPVNKVSVNACYSRLSVEQVIAYREMMPPGIELELWTIDDPEAYKAFMPYVSAITSNKICANKNFEN